MTSRLHTLHEAGVLSSLDVHFARAMDRLVPNQPPAVLLGAALASREVAGGHVCADLRRVLQRPLLDAEGRPLAVELPSIFEWVMALGQSPLCSDGSRPTPLVLDGEARLYLARYWRYQSRLATALRDRAASPFADIDTQWLADGVRRMFASEGSVLADAGQMCAAAIAVLRRLAVISGGPGTGKTSTVVRVLALLAEEARAAGRPWPRVAMLAPTGKAAARLQESVAAGREALPCDDAVKEALRLEASTIHRRLGYRPGSPTRFAHDADNPLPADIVLVDEASMVDLALMAKLVAAVPAHARLILLGDKDQLASVEAGAILGDICNTTGERTYSRPFAAQLRAVLGSGMPDVGDAGPERTGIWDCIALLTRSFRFRADGGIGRLARAVGTGRASDALQQLETGDAQVQLVDLVDPQQLARTLRPAVLDAFTPYLRARDPVERLALLGRYRLLSAHRRGPFGTERLNAMAEDLLEGAGLLHRNDPVCYDGRPILVTHNDYQLELFNGDVGVVHEESDGRMYAYFPGPSGADRLRRFAPSRLPPHESVWAMTVHTSQGSEFDRIGLLLPPQLSPILTRELVYTALTRAREHATLYGSPSVLADAIARRIDRASGLREALWRSY
jgi:exodeoxyribonuclease V alpha subunit